MKNKYASFISKKRNIIFILLLLIALIVVSSYVYYSNEKNGIFEEQKKELQTIAELKINQISHWYVDELNDAEIISQSTILNDLIKKCLMSNDEKIHKEITDYLEELKREHDYAEIILVSTDQEVICSSNKKLEEVDPLIKVALTKSSQTKSTIPLDLFKAQKLKNKIFLGFVSPLYGYDNKQVASIVFLHDGERFLFPLVKLWPIFGRTTESLIFRKEGNNVLFLNELRHLKNTALQLKIPFSRQDLPAVKAALGARGIVEGKDYRGVDVYAYVDSIPGTDWLMVTKIDKSEMFEDMNDEVVNIVLISLLLIFATVIFLSFLYSSRQKNVYRELYNKEKELLRLEERYRITVESLGDGIITADTSGKVLYLNKTAEKLTGWSLHEARGRTLHEIYYVKNEQTGEHENNIVEKVLKYGIVKELANHTILVSKDENEIPVRDTGAPIYDRDGTIAGLVLTFQDETEKRTQRRIIEENEKRFRTSLDNMLEGCQIIDNEWRYIYVNDSAAMHGKVNKKELVGKTMMEVYPGIENTELFETLKYCKKHSVRKQMENEFIYPDGTKGWFELSVEPVYEGLFILSIDITKRKLSEDALKESEENYRSIVENINDIIFTMSKDGVIDYISPVSEKQLGFKPEEIMGKNINEFLQDSTLEKAMQYFEDFKLGNLKPIELNIFDKDGNKKWIRVSRAPIIKNDEIIGMRGVISDITEKVEVLSKITEAKEKAEELNRLKSHFFANMSHELRTPFVGIMGFAELLSETLTDPEAKEMAEGILITSMRMRDTLTKILDLSKLEFQGVQPAIKQVEINNLISSVKKEFEKAAENKNLLFSFKSNFEKCLIDTDPKLFSEILNNLVSNAIIYTNRGSVKIISDIKNENGKEFLLISVIDTGIGIAKDKQKIIWDEFRQVSEGFNRSFQGTGLGLAIAKKYCDLLGFSIYLDSEVGQGSKFILKISLSESGVHEKVSSKNISPESKDPTNIYQQTNKKILCVEDDEVSIEVLKRALSKNYIVDTAHNAEVALDKVQNNQYDAILMDINLGVGLNGEELTHKIKKIPKYENVPIVAVTAYASENDKREFLSNGMSYYLSKPFMIKDLLALMDEVFS